MSNLPKKPDGRIKSSPGRRKGSKNKTSAEAQQAVLDSLTRRDAAQAKLFAANPATAGSPHYLDTLDDKLFTQLVGRVLPKDIHMDVEGRLSWAQFVATDSKD